MTRKKKHTIDVVLVPGLEPRSLLMFDPGFPFFMIGFDARPMEINLVDSEASKDNKQETKFKKIKLRDK